MKNLSQLDELEAEARRHFKKLTEIYSASFLR